MHLTLVGRWAVCLDRVDDEGVSVVSVQRNHGRDLGFAGPRMGFGHKGSPVGCYSVWVCASNGTKLLASICINRKSFPVMCVSHSVHDSKLDESDLGRVPFRTSLQGWPTRDGCRNLKSSKPAQRGGGDEDDGCDNGRAAATPTASNGSASIATGRTGSPTPPHAGEVVGGRGPHQQASRSARR